MATHDDRMQWSITRRKGVTEQNNETSSWKKYKSVFESSVFLLSLYLLLVYPILSFYSLGPYFADDRTLVAANLPQTWNHLTSPI